jgi:hypothetical protein
MRHSNHPAAVPSMVNWAMISGALSTRLCKVHRLRVAPVSDKPHFPQDDSYLVPCQAAAAADFFFFSPAAGLFPRRDGLPARLC